jgi:hypothetical protein
MHNKIRMPQRFPNASESLAPIRAIYTKNSALSVLAEAGRIARPNGGIKISLIIQRFPGAFGKKA